MEDNSSKYTVDSEYKGKMNMVFPVISSSKAGLMRIFKPRSKTFLVVDVGKQHIILLPGWKKKLTDFVKFEDIHLVVTDLRKKSEGKFYTEVITTHRVFRFKFADALDWFHFTEVFRHVKGEFDVPLFKATEDYYQAAMQALEGVKYSPHVDQHHSPVQKISQIQQQGKDKEYDYSQNWEKAVVQDMDSEDEKEKEKDNELKASSKEHAELQIANQQPNEAEIKQSENLPEVLSPESRARKAA